MPNARNVFLLTKQTSLFVYYIEFWASTAAAAATSMGIYAWLVVCLPIGPPSEYLFFTCPLRNGSMRWLTPLIVLLPFLSLDWSIVVAIYFLHSRDRIVRTNIYVHTISLFDAEILVHFRSYSLSIPHKHAYSFHFLCTFFSGEFRKKNRPTVAIAVRVMFVCSFIHISQSTIQRHRIIRSTENVGLCEEAMYTWHLFDMRMVKTMFECAWCRQWQWQRKVPFFHHTSMFIWRKAFCNI